MPLPGSSTQPLDLDFNLVNGQTYTFQFYCNNLFCFSDLSTTIFNDIIAQAPSFLTSVGVSSPTGGGWFAATKALYNVQFTYEGDNTDVVSDVAASIVAAVKAVSNDDIVYNGGVAATARSITVTPAQAVAATAQVAVSATKTAITDVGDVAKTATNQATDLASAAISKSLAAILPVLIVVVVLVLFVLPSLAGSVRKSGVTLA
jgi:hypothetical protein